MPYEKFSSREEAEAFAEEQGSSVGSYDSSDGGVGYVVRYDNSDEIADDVGGGLEDFWREFSGEAQLERERAYNEMVAARNRAYWDDLGGQIPSADDLSVDYASEGSSDEYGDLLMGDSRLEGMDQGRQEVALGALRGIMRGSGYTAADRAQMAAARQAQAQELGARNAATRAQMQARGMGGSGAALAAQMSGNEAMAGASAMGDAAIQQAAMQRYLGATQNYGALSSTMQGQEMARRQALDAYNQANMDWRRGREQRNTGWENRSRESEADSQQQWWENQRDIAAGKTNQYSTDRQADENSQRRQQQTEDRAYGVIGTIGEGIFG